jgi:hypothetical protein
VTQRSLKNLRQALLLQPMFNQWPYISLRRFADEHFDVAKVIAKAAFTP